MSIRKLVMTFCAAIAIGAGSLGAATQSAEARGVETSPTIQSLGSVAGAKTAFRGLAPVANVTSGTQKVAGIWDKVKGAAKKAGRAAKKVGRAAKKAGRAAKKGAKWVKNKSRKIREKFEKGKKWYRKGKRAYNHIKKRF